MGTAYQPKIVTDGLAFIYDTGSGKSYKGEPTTNVNTLTLSDSGTDGSGQSSVGTRTVITDNHVRIVDVSSNTRQSHLITGLTASTTYTISIMYKKLDGTPTFRFQIQDYSGAAYLRTIKFTNTTEIGIEDREGWQQASWTFTLGSDANAVRIWYQDGADYTTYTHSFELQNPQLEAKSHATPYVDGTRSATQGLLDLTNTATIDISNASFDSDAQMTFDGTDDYLTLGSNSTLQAIGSNATIECWFKSSSTVGSKFALMVGWGEGTSYYSNFGIGNWFSAWPDESIYVGVNSAAVVYAERDGSAKYHDGNWHHAVGLIGQNNHKIFVDGSEVSVSFAYGSDSVSTSNIFGFSSGTEVYIGLRPYGNGHFQGDLPVVKIYDRLLTAAEVLQNFNASRDRFKI